MGSLLLLHLHCVSRGCCAHTCKALGLDYQMGECASQHIAVGSGDASPFADCQCQCLLAEGMTAGLAGTFCCCYLGTQKYDPGLVALHLRN